MIYLVSTTVAAAPPPQIRRTLSLVDIVRELSIYKQMIAVSHKSVRTVGLCVQKDTSNLPAEDLFYGVRSLRPSKCQWNAFHQLCSRSLQSCYLSVNLLKIYAWSVCSLLVTSPENRKNVLKELAFFMPDVRPTPCSETITGRLW